MCLCSGVSRRSLLLGGIGLIATSRLPFVKVAQAQTAPDWPEHCTAVGALNIPDLVRRGLLFGKSGDDNLDLSINAELLNLSDTLGVLPGFKYYQDDAQKNAWASGITVVPGTWGTVSFGLNFLFDFLHASSWGGMTVAGLLAHEFGHIYQYRSGYYVRLRSLHTTVKAVELHADYLSGFYLASRKNLLKQNVETYATDLYGIGDNNFNNPEHHGTSVERRNALEAGFSYGYDSNVGIAQAAKAGYQYVYSNV